MKVTIDASPSYSIAYCHLDYAETVHVENDGMALMSDGISVKSGSGTGGITKGLIRKAFGGESFFMGAYTAQVQGAWVGVCPKFPGDVLTLNLDEIGPVVAQSGSILAFEDSVKVGVKVAGLSQAMATRGLTLLGISGSGQAIICSYGALREFQVGAGQSMIVDTGHLVAYTEGMRADVGMLGGVVTATTTGEDFVCRLEGPGRVYIQTRAERGLRNWLDPERYQNG